MITRKIFIARILGGILGGILGASVVSLAGEKSKVKNGGFVGTDGDSDLIVVWDGHSSISKTNFNDLKFETYYIDPKTDFSKPRRKFK